MEHTNQLAVEPATGEADRIPLLGHDTPPTRATVVIVHPPAPAPQPGEEEEKAEDGRWRLRRLLVALLMVFIVALLTLVSRLGR